MSTALDQLKTEALPEVEEELSEPDGTAHYARAKAIISGGVVVALCGKRWIPVIRGAEVLDKPICKTCESLFKMLRSMD